MERIPPTPPPLRRKRSSSREGARTEAEPITRETYTRLVEALVDQVDLEVVAFDLSARVRLVNRKAARRLADPFRAVGRSLFECLPFLDGTSGGIDWKETILRNLLEKGRSAEIRAVPLDGRRYDVRVFPLVWGNRRIGGAAVLDDVTHRAESQEEDLRQARTMSLANLGASIAHEIRNPLNSIALNIQLLKEELERAPSASEAVARTIRTSLHGIDRLNRIIRDFLQFARPPQVALRMDDPNGAVLSALQLLEGQIQRSGVDVSVRLSPLPWILMDAERLSEAIYNLALNAIQAMEGRPRRLLSVTSAVEEGNVIVALRDTGGGVSPEVLPRLFDLFFTTREGGSGLGLPYAEGVVKAHQGTIRVGNSGEGAVFSIVLPVPIRLSGTEEKR